MTFNKIIIIIILSSGKVIIIDQHLNNGIHNCYDLQNLSSLYRITGCNTFTTFAIMTIMIQENLHTQSKCEEEHFFDWMFLNLTAPGRQSYCLMWYWKEMSVASFAWPIASFKHSYNHGKNDFWKYYMESAPCCQTKQCLGS